MESSSNNNTIINITILQNHLDNDDEKYLNLDTGNRILCKSSYKIKYIDGMYALCSNNKLVLKSAIQQLKSLKDEKGKENITYKTCRYFLNELKKGIKNLKYSNELEYICIDNDRSDYVDKKFAMKRRWRNEKYKICSYDSQYKEIFSIRSNIKEYLNLDTGFWIPSEIAKNKIWYDDEYKICTNDIALYMILSRNMTTDIESSEISDNLDMLESHILEHLEYNDNKYLNLDTLNRVSESTAKRKDNIYHEYCICGSDIEIFKEAIQICKFKNIKYLHLDTGNYVTHYFIKNNKLTSNDTYKICSKNKDLLNSFISDAIKYSRIDINGNDKVFIDISENCEEKSNNKVFIDISENCEEKSNNKVFIDISENCEEKSNDKVFIDIGENINEDEKSDDTSSDIKYLNVDTNRKVIKTTAESKLYCNHEHKICGNDKKLFDKYIKNPTEKKRRKTIPKKIKNDIWYRNFGESYNGFCWVCNDKINVFNFDCGHIQSVKNGGSDNIDNLNPLCSKCNSSMGTQNMIEYKKQYY